MATTLSTALPRSVPVGTEQQVALDGDPLPACIAIQIDDEVMMLRRPEWVGSNPVLVKRAWNGSFVMAHEAGATVTPLYYSLTSTPGGSEE